MNRSQWRFLAAGACLLWALPAWAAQPIAGFPRRVSGNAPGKDPILVNSPIAVQVAAEGQGRVFFGAGNDLHCVTLSAADCDGFPRRLGDRVGIVGAPAV